MEFLIIFNQFLNLFFLIQFQASKEIIYRVVENGEENQPFTDEIANAVINLWSDKGVKKAYDMRSEYQLNDSAKQ